jgi:hypothetical protein
VPRATEDLYDSGDDHSVTSGAYAYVTLQIKKYVTINGGPCPHPTHWTRETAYNLTDDQYEDAKQNFAVVLDTGATIHAFGNSDLLVGKHSSIQECVIGGFAGNLMELRLKEKGMFQEFGEVWTNPKLKVNLLSVSLLRDDGAIIAYRGGQKDDFIVKPKFGQNWYVFKRETGANGNLYTCRFEKAIRWGGPLAETLPHGHFRYFVRKVNFSTVLDNMSQFTNAECKQAAYARI